ncbi:MAG: hypothetical protein JO125_03000 [Chloroflexi bacterium]|nr:hypothetical protein [Ktedonobacteraceae bacterium]MBV8822723.1 hypothetical protein [Ktedonobacteraceae bacterium]MBV9706360.1 hypothetical protein [Chloroflexota bacterium]
MAAVLDRRYAPYSAFVAALAILLGILVLPAHWDGLALAIGGIFLAAFAYYVGSFTWMRSLAWVRILNFFGYVAGVLLFVTGLLMLLGAGGLLVHYLFIIFVFAVALFMIGLGAGGWMHAGLWRISALLVPVGLALIVLQALALTNTNVNLLATFWGRLLLSIFLIWLLGVGIGLMSERRSRLFA